MTFSPNNASNLKYFPGAIIIQSPLFFHYRIYGFYDECKRRYNIKLWKTFTDCFNCLPVSKLNSSFVFLVLFTLEDLCKSSLFLLYCYNSLCGTAAFYSYFDLFTYFHLCCWDMKVYLYHHIHPLRWKTKSFEHTSWVIMININKLWQLQEHLNEFISECHSVVFSLNAI